MATEQFQVETSKTIQVGDLQGGAGITANGEYDLYVSDDIQNNNNLSALRLVVDYESAIPDWVTQTRNWDIVLVVQGNNGLAVPNRRYFPIAHQFEPYRNPAQGPRRVIIVGRDVPNAEGVDDIIYIGGKVTDRISRQSSKVLRDFRVHMKLLEYGFGTPAAFQSVTFSIYGDKFDG